MPDHNFMMEPVFEEWIQKEHPLSDGQHRKDVRHAFYVGAWVALGLYQRAMKLPDAAAIRVINQLIQETKKNTMPVNGEPARKKIITPPGFQNG